MQVNASRIGEAARNLISSSFDQHGGRPSRVAHGLLFPMHHGYDVGRF